jgi:hypothetical protein
MSYRLEQLEPAVVDLLRCCPVRQGPAEVAPLDGRRHRRGEGRRPPGQQRGEDRVPRRRRGQLGLGRHRAQQVHERQVRQPDVTEVDAVPGQHPHSPLGRVRGELIEQAGLAHPGVTGQQDRGGAAGGGPVDVRQQVGELGSPSHHRGVIPAWHGVDRGTGLRQDRAGAHADGPGQRGRRRLRNHAPGLLRVPRPAAISISRR